MDEKGEVVVTLNEHGECILVSRQNEEHEILSIIWEKPGATESTIPPPPEVEPDTCGLCGCSLAGAKFYPVVLLGLQVAVCPDCAEREGERRTPHPGAGTRGWRRWNTCKAKSGRFGNGCLVCRW